MVTVDLDSYVDGVLAADRSTLGRAITLVESTLPDHRQQAEELLTRLLPHTGGAHRVGVSGVPGSGKSTLVDASALASSDHGHRVAVLAVDPSSSLTGGSILGDKTRMTRLAVSDARSSAPRRRPGASAASRGATRESVLVLEAAGFDVVFVETVGVGQSESGGRRHGRHVPAADARPTRVTPCRASRRACSSSPT